MAKKKEPKPTLPDESLEDADLAHHMGLAREDPDTHWFDSSRDGWIGVDFDGTLCSDSAKWPGMGNPIPAMMERVRTWLDAGIEVRIVTARAGEGPRGVREVQAWLVRHGLPALRVTDRKDFRMLQLWDDRAVRVERNTGRIVGDEGIEVHDRLRRKR